MLHDDELSDVLLEELLEDDEHEKYCSLDQLLHEELHELEESNELQLEEQQ